MPALREIFARLGFEFDGKALDGAKKKTDGLLTTLKGVVGVLAAQRIAQGVREFAAELDVFDDLSAQTGVAADKLQFYGYVARTNGSSIEEMAASLTLLQKALGATDEGSKLQTDALKKLGIATKDAHGNSATLSGILPQIFDRFANLRSEAEKAGVANSLFGRSGVKLIPTLDKGAAGLAALNKEFQQFGGPVSVSTVEAAGRFRDALERLDTATFALKGRLAESLFPILETLFNTLGRGIGTISNLAKGTDVAKAAIVVLGGVAATALAPLVASFILPAAAIAALILALDDLFVFLEGGKSELGALIDKVFGPGSQKQAQAWIASIRNGLNEMLNTARNNSAEFRATWNRALDDIGRHSSVLRAITDVTYTVINASKDGFSGLLRFVLGVLHSIAFNVEVVGDALEQSFAYAVAAVGDMFGNLWDSIVNGVHDTLGALGNVASKLGLGSLGAKLSGAVGVAGPREQLRDRVTANAEANTKERIKEAEAIGQYTGFLPAAATLPAAPAAPVLAPSVVNNIRIELPPGANAKDVGAAAASGATGGTDRGMRAARQSLTQRIAQ